MWIVGALGAAVTGLVLRLSFVWLFSYYESGDTPVYEAMAQNWLLHGVLGIRVGGRIEPVDIRTPGYPAFLAAIYRLYEPSATAVMIAQSIVDLATCFLVAAIAWRIAPDAWRRRAALTALWLSALCPFTANYAATILSETLATFLTAATLLLLVDCDFEGPPGLGRLFAAGVVSGIGALVRPEAPLVLGAAALVWAARPPRARLVAACAVMAAGLALPLAPWTLRNWVEIHRFDPLARRYADLPSEHAPRGFYAWTSTWLWRFEDVDRVVWSLEEKPIHVEDVPPSAFDSTEERERIRPLIESYDRKKGIDAALDAEFARIAEERTARRPWRTWLTIPGLRALTLWVTPRVDMLPVADGFLPVGEQWENDPQGYALLVGFTVLDVVYIALALAGTLAARARPGARLLVVFVALRTAFVAGYALTPEPRYVVECFPALVALGAQFGYLRKGFRS